MYSVLLCQALMYFYVKPGGGVSVQKGFKMRKVEGYPHIFQLISYVVPSQAKMYLEVTQVVSVAGKYVLSFPDSTYQEYKLGLPTESSLAYDKSYHTFNMLDCLRIRVAAPFFVSKSM